MPRSYSYVGPARLIAEMSDVDLGRDIDSRGDLREWLETQEDWFDGSLIGTFVILPDHRLRLSARRTEHVECARGSSVLAAGELEFRSDPDPRVIGASNQSTGYCPEPDCWEVARAVLSQLGILCPFELTDAYRFRFCIPCAEICLIKDDDFHCVFCERELPRAWNFAQ